MLPDFDIPPTARDNWLWLKATYGDYAREIVLQYGRMREVAPLALQDMRLFLFGRESTYVGNDAGGREHARREGMRTAWLRFDCLSQLTEAQIDQIETQLESETHGRTSRYDNAGPGDNDVRTRRSLDKHIAAGN